MLVKYSCVIVIWNNLAQLIGCANWTIISPPIIFGKTAKLGCNENNINEKSTITWQGGPKYVPLSLNVISSNLTKYRESNFHQPFQSILEIYRFSEDDVDCNYSCTVGFREDNHVLNLNKKEFEWHPNADSIAVASTLRKGILSVDVRLIQVYPEPVCRFLFEGRDLSRTTTKIIGKNGKIFRAKMTLDHTFETEICKGELRITCKVGKTDVHVYLKDFNTCKDKPIYQSTTHPTHKHNNLVRYHDTVLAVLIIVGLFAVVALLTVVMFAKCPFRICTMIPFRRRSRDGQSFTSVPTETTM